MHAAAKTLAQAPGFAKMLPMYKSDESNYPGVLS